MSEPGRDSEGLPIAGPTHRQAVSADRRGWLARAFGLGDSRASAGGFDFNAMHKSLTILERRSNPGE